MSAGIYIHIPFCIKKCSYCDFYSLSYDEPLKDLYLKALLKEIDRASFAGEIKTVYIGGGTPSLLSPSEVEVIINKLLQKFRLSHEAEITVEINPGTIDPQKIRALGNAGINRLSIGIQSLQPRELGLLGRIHDRGDALNALEWTGRFFDNYSVDIIYGIPGQSLSGLRDNLDLLVRYNPPHISAYELSVEEGTPLSTMVSKGEITIPPDDDKSAMFDLTADHLARNGYIHYEISSYSRKGYHCRHNMNYWMRGEYLGFGASAHAFINERRFRNVSDVFSYVRLMEREGSAVVEETPLTDMDRIKEELFLKLRTVKGINIDGLPIPPALLQSLEEYGFIQRGDRRISLTEKGMLLSNRVIVELLVTVEKYAPDC